MSRIIGLLISGASVRLAGAAAAIWVGHLGYVTLTTSLAHVNAALSVVQ